jgi:hypothetical protein
MRILRAWTIHNSITNEDIKVLEAALSGLVGVEYKPEMLATQVVNGTNYCFICKSKVVALNGPEGISKIMIFKPLVGEPKIKSIASII